MVKSPFFVNFHLIWSPSVIEGKLDAQNWKKSSTTFASQSLGPQMKRTSQVLLFLAPWHIKDDSTEASLIAAKFYKTGKVKWSGRSPHHLSVQNFTLSPTHPDTSPQITPMSTPSQLRGPPQPTPPPPPNSSPNFKATTLLQSLFSSIPKR